MEWMHLHLTKQAVLYRTNIAMALPSRPHNVDIYQTPIHIKPAIHPAIPDKRQQIELIGVGQAPADSVSLCPPSQGR